MVTRLILRGVGVELECDSAAIHERFAFDFAGFEPTPLSFGQFKFQVVLREPEVPPGLEESFRGPNGICFDRGEVRHICYPGPIWLSYDYASETALLQGMDVEAVYFHLYLAILSRVGERLDSVGLHRVHALGLSSPQAEGCLVLMPPGGGKSTLGVAMLALPGWRLLSEDTPMLDSLGCLFPFHFRLGLRDAVKGVPEEMIRASGRKVLVRADAYPLQQTPVPCRWVLAGARTTAAAPRIEPLSKRAGFGLLVRDCVVGFGLPQITELFVRLRARDVIRKARIAWRRSVCVGRLTLRARFFRIYLCPDPARNAQFLAEFLERGVGA